MKTKRSAFTLVELLVVIGIIALLISILLPTLSKARQNAMRVKCAAQLRQVGVAAVIYANQNKGQLPPMHWEGHPNWAVTASSLWGNNGSNYNYAFTNHWGKSPADPVNDPGANLGRLIRTKCLTSSDANWTTNPILYCPAANKENDPTKQGYYTYSFNVHIKSVTSTGLHERWWPRLANYGKVPTQPVNTDFGSRQFLKMPYALGADPISPLDGLGYATHSVGRSRAWNLLYADGSVRTAITDARGDRGAGKWTRFLDQLGYLERVADGQQVSNPPKYGTGEYNAIPIDP